MNVKRVVRIVVKPEYFLSYFVLYNSLIFVHCTIIGFTLDITNLATNTALNAKINEVKNEIPSITNFATNVSLNAKKK